MKWTVREEKPTSKWHVGPRIWWVDKKWRLRLYRPWNDVRVIEVESTSIFYSIYILGIGAGWWKGP